MIKCRTLGPLAILVNGEAPSKELTRKSLSLLMYVLFAPHHRRSKEAVIGTLWPDARNPTGALAQTTYVLRDEGEVDITEKGDQVVLDVASIELDSTLFDRLLRERKWVEAAALIAGDFLEGLAPKGTSGFDDWLGAERRRWREKFVEVLTRASELRLDAGDAEQAVSLAERARYFGEHSEAALRAHMKGLVLLDRTNEALEAFEHFARNLKEELERDPEPATIQLAAHIRSHQRKRPDPKDGETVRAPLIGRSEALTRVLDVWRASLAGQAGIALVIGDAGMGKTRFADEVIARAGFDGAAVAVVRAVPGDVDRPGIGLTTLLESSGLLRARGVPAAPSAALAAMGKESFLWAEKFPVKPSGEPLLHHQAVTEVLRAVAAESPMLLVAEDAQEMDRKSWQALIALVRSLPTTRLMVLITASREPVRNELEDLRARIGRDLKGVSVTLDPLTHVELVALARWALPDYDADQLDRIARRVNVESGGLPLIAYAIFTAVAEGLDLRKLTEPWPPKGRTLYTVLPTELPDNLLGAINVGFGRLSSDAQAALRALAVLGEPCTSERICRGADLPPARIDKALDELEWRRWLVADSRGYAFVARAIRDAVKEKQVTKGEARRIEQRVIDT